MNLKIMKVFCNEVCKFYKDVFFHTPTEVLNEEEIDSIKKFGLIHLSYKKNEDKIRKNGIESGHARPMNKREKNFTWYYINYPDKFEEYVEIVHGKGNRKNYDMYAEMKELTEEQISKLRIRRKHYDNAVIYPGTLKTTSISINNL